MTKRFDRQPMLVAIGRRPQPIDLSGCVCPANPATARPGIAPTAGLPASGRLSWRCGSISPHGSLAITFGFVLRSPVVAARTVEAVGQVADRKRLRQQSAGLPSPADEQRPAGSIVGFPLGCCLAEAMQLRFAFATA